MTVTAASKVTSNRTASPARYHLSSVEASDTPVIIVRFTITPLNVAAVIVVVSASLPLASLIVPPLGEMGLLVTVTRSAKSPTCNAYVKVRLLVFEPLR